MKVTGLDGREYSWNPSGSESSSDKRSKLHKEAKELLDILFPYDRILEEVSLVGTNKLLSSFGDNFLNCLLWLCIFFFIFLFFNSLVSKFNKFFFKDKLSFFKAQARDRDKKEWCNLNDIRLIEFNYDEDWNDWRRKIS